VLGRRGWEVEGVVQEGVEEEALVGGEGGE
jgi:hypothetical protein